MRSQQLFLGITAIEVCVVGHHQEFEVLGIHRDKLHAFVSEPPMPGDKRESEPTLSTPSIRRLMVVDWHSSNHSRYVS